MTHIDLPILSPSAKALADHAFQVVAREFELSADRIQALGIPEIFGLLIAMNIIVRRLLRIGASPDLVLQMVSDSMSVALRQG